MQVQKLSHELIDPIEYYLVKFESEYDIINFINNYCSVFIKEDGQTWINKPIVIKYNKDLKEYEFFQPIYLKNYFEKEAGIYSSLYNNLVNFCSFI